MSNYTVGEVRQYMELLIAEGECTDSAGVVSPTQLAEAASDWFDGYDPDGEIDELFWELAADMAGDGDA